MEESKETNKFINELKKFIDKKVTVTDLNGTSHKGICKAIMYQHLNVIVMSEKEKIIVKNIASIKRDRDTSWKEEKKKE